MEVEVKEEPEDEYTNHIRTKIIEDDEEEEEQDGDGDGGGEKEEKVKKMEQMFKLDWIHFEETVVDLTGEVQVEENDQMKFFEIVERFEIKFKEDEKQKRKNVDQRKKGGSPDENDIHDYDNAVKKLWKTIPKMDENGRRRLKNVEWKLMR